jgi:hypothetical protein
MFHIEKSGNPDQLNRFYLKSGLRGFQGSPGRIVVGVGAAHALAVLRQSKADPPVGLAKPPVIKIQDALIKYFWTVFFLKHTT